MSYGTAACSAWLIEATHENFCKLEAIPVNVEGVDVERLLKDKDYYYNWLDEACFDRDIELSTCFGIKAWIWTYSDGDIYDDLDEGTFYISFPHNALFEPSQVLLNMNARGVSPQYSHWVQSG